MLLEALDGDEAAMTRFFRGFLEASLYVPDRHQAIPLTNQPVYPSDLFAILGVQDIERSLIPCFCSEEALQRWTPSRLSCSQVRGIELCKRVPDGWWLVLDPGQEASKEFSPWELSKLRQGAEAISEIIADLSQSESVAVLEVEPLDHTAFPVLSETLIAAAQNYSSLERLYLAREHTTSAEGEKLSNILVGALCAADAVETIQRALQERCDLLQIGDERLRVIAAASPDILQFSLFAKITPFWTKPSLFTRAVRALGLKARSR